MTGYATVLLVGGPARGREIKTPIRDNAPSVCESCGQQVYAQDAIPALFYAKDKRGRFHTYKARTTTAKDGDVVKADHLGVTKIDGAHDTR